MRNRTIPNWVTILLSGAGAGATLVTARSEDWDSPVSAPIIGVGMFLILLVAGVLRGSLEERIAFATPGDPDQPTVYSASQLRATDALIWAGSLVGTASAWWLQYTAFCASATMSGAALTAAGLVTAIFLVASENGWLRSATKPTGARALWLAPAALLLLVGVAAWPNVNRQWHKLHTPVVNTHIRAHTRHHHPARRA